MRRWPVTVLMLVAVAGGTFATASAKAAGAPSTAAGAPSAAKPTITSVVISGTVHRPVITVHGHGFGRKPTPNPSYRPPGHPLCPVKAPTGNLSRYGWDYGSSKLFLIDKSQSPAWSAGRYRPKLGELDCIGVIITKYTATTIVFRLGGAYPHYPGSTSHYTLAAGDRFLVGVAGARKYGAVSYA